MAAVQGAVLSKQNVKAGAAKRVKFVYNPPLAFAHDIGRRRQPGRVGDGSAAAEMDYATALYPLWILSIGIFNFYGA